MGEPKRIASLLSSATEICFGLGLGEHLVAVSHECDYPPAAADKPRITRSNVRSAAVSRAIDEQVRELAHSQSALYEIDVDLLARLAPDLIITQAQCDICAVRYEDVLAAVRDQPALRGAEVMALNPRSLGEVLTDILRIATAIDRLPAAQRWVAEMTGRVEHVRRQTTPLAVHARPRVCCLEWIDPPMLAANWMPELIAWAGGRCSVAASGEHSSYASWNDIVEYGPQVVIVMPCGFDLPRTLCEAEVLPTWPGWSTLAAVKGGRVFAVDGNALFNRSGPRLVDSLELLAALLHPELFASPPGIGRDWQPIEHKD